MACGESQESTSSSSINPQFFEASLGSGQKLITISYRVVGEPKPKGRPRVVRNPRTGFINTYTPKTTVDWEKEVAQQSIVAINLIKIAYGEESIPLLQGRIAVHLRFNIKRPKSAPKSIEYPLKGADIDNLGKSILDSLQGASIIKDDKTVSDISWIKRFADEDHPEGVEIEIMAWIDEM